MTEVLTRTFAPDIEIRSGGDGRTVHGIAVPYSRPQRIHAGLTEQFARGAFAKQLTSGHRVPFTRDHQAQGGQIIGKVLELRDDAAGLYFEARVAKTAMGNDTLELLRDGALDQVSIGFQEGQNRRLSGGIVERVTATLRELSVVPEGAYGDFAVAMGVRSVQPLRLDEARQILASLPTLLPM
ncbi:HK97 family phage prohead protease [Pseudonocardia halophobica]|uniref:Prohead serine protease domain-containing protein n=1 Tax=Pseudonocardia halophobica TaxID=29401 RepID=A0A9W6NYG7_9PSEU|nr:HK97 family phage prohead protease [Pseudonocardia halophobica]GLL13467.1 hypothetical protein GCM10017577_46110 [Pseudonocardia halophobica]